MIYGQATDTFDEGPHPEGLVAVTDRDALAAALERVLPSTIDTSAAFRAAVLRQAAGVEFVPAKRAHQRLWLESDVAGPGFGRQKIYGFLTIDAVDLEAIAAGEDTGVGDLLREHTRLVVDAAQRLGERVATFRAYNCLTDAHAVTVRSFCPSLLYLRARGEPGIGLRVDEPNDTYHVRLGAYFHVCPPGDEWIPSECVE